MTSLDSLSNLSTIKSKPYLELPWNETTLPYEHGAVRVIEDSVSPDGFRLTTLEGRLWRPLNGEKNTHRGLSKNSASLRAIPSRRPKDRKGTLDIVEDHPAEPLVWGSEKPGMQSGAQLTGADLEAAQAIWREHRRMTIEMVEQLAAIGLHKSVANRLLEPHLWQTIVFSATSWENFLNLRSSRRSDQAQGEIAAFADGVIDALESSRPTLRGYDDTKIENWHLPFVLPEEREIFTLDQGRDAAAARTCRVSRINHDNTEPSLEQDQKTAGSLKVQRPMHASPFEHVAVPIEPGVPSRCNFRGFRQWRHELEDQYEIDSTL